MYPLVCISQDSKMIDHQRKLTFITLIIIIDFEFTSGPVNWSRGSSSIRDNMDITSPSWSCYQYTHSVHQRVQWQPFAAVHVESDILALFFFNQTYYYFTNTPGRLFVDRIVQLAQSKHHNFLHQMKTWLNSILLCVIQRKSKIYFP